MPGTLITPRVLTKAFAPERKTDIHRTNQSGMLLYARAPAAGDIVRRGSGFSKPVGLKDLILSVLTFGIYCWVKLATQERRAEELKALISALHVKAKACQPGDEFIEEDVGGKTLKIHSLGYQGLPLLRVSYDGVDFLRIEGVTISDFGSIMFDEILEHNSGTGTFDRLKSTPKWEDLRHGYPEGGDDQLLDFDKYYNTSGKLNEYDEGETGWMVWIKSNLATRDDFLAGEEEALMKIDYI
ncbi:hypothetical protein IAG25_39035 [Caballeronia sp. EK]|uniref:hypothetical protein n=1 Tax=Caballeronia sp. EK TaxID=2767469 RepID=UPI00165623DE|nr:hypothetical protein [Caballeronia sp. EK]MBC8642791.1 hypothetical protein [Caballeronia sp. EK]